MKLYPLSVTLLVATMLTACNDTGGSVVEKLHKAAEMTMGQGGVAVLGSEEIAAGLKEALTKGTGAVVSQLGQEGGFSNDPVVRVALPSSLLKAKEVASKVGMTSYFDDLENRLNEAAEVATPLAKDLFVGAIKGMSLTDAKGILDGSDNAATAYFQEKTADQLKTQMNPIVANSLEQVGAVRSLNSLLDAYKKIPFAPKIDTDLTQHVVDAGSKGIFHYVAEEEKAIREDPLKRTSDLLKRVFAD